MPSLMRSVQIASAAVMLAIVPAAALRAQEKTAAASVVSGQVVHIDNFSFTPAEITVAPGATVTWINGDDIPHTVAASNKAFRSKVMDTEQQFTFTFKDQGTYEYFCSLHPHMTGKVIVK